MNVFTYLSLGAGVESSALMVLSALGLRGCPRAEVAIFADTQDEPRWVYEQRDAMAVWGAGHGLPVVTVTRGQLSMDRRVQIPAFVLSDGEAAPLSRSCTRDYKIQPIRKEARRLMEARGLKQAVCLYGISVGDDRKLNISPVLWIQNRYPLVEAGMTRSACARVLTEAGLPVPRKSACWQCPYHGDPTWREIRDYDPASWEKALAYDDLVRAQRGASLHRSLIPLRDVDLGVDEPDMFSEDCSGHCGV